MVQRVGGIVLEKYKVMFKGYHVGDLTVSKENYAYCVNEEAIEDIGNKYPIFDILRKDVVAKSIPFFKVRLEHAKEKFETDDYELVAY